MDAALASRDVLAATLRNSGILAGSRSEKVLAKRHDQLSTEGIGKKHSAAKWAELARQFARKGLIEIESGAFPTVTTIAEGIAFLREKRRVSGNPRRGRTQARGLRLGFHEWYCYFSRNQRVPPLRPAS